MEEKTFFRLKLFLFSLCHTPHIIIVILRMLVQYRRDFVVGDWTLTDDQFQYLRLTNASMNIVWLKIGIYGSILYFCCCCCCCTLKCSFKVTRFMYFVDFAAGMILVCDIPLERNTATNDGHTLKVYPVNVIEICFLVCLGVMNAIDLFSCWLFTVGLSNGFYDDAGYRRPSYDTLASTPVQIYGTVARPRPTAPSYQVLRQPPPNIQVAGLREASLILSDGEGGLIFVRQITANTATANQGSGVHRSITQTQIVLITREAIARNPFNPEVHVLTETEISQMNFGRQQNTITSALR